MYNTCTANDMYMYMYYNIATSKELGMVCVRYSLSLSSHRNTCTINTCDKHCPPLLLVCVLSCSPPSLLHSSLPASLSPSFLPPSLSPSLPPSFLPPSLSPSFFPSSLSLSPSLLPSSLPPHLCDL